MSRLVLPLLLVAAAEATQMAVAGVAGADAIVGFWQTEHDEAIIEIRPHGETYRGQLVWLREPRYPADDPRGLGGQRVTDRHNPDLAKRDRPLIGRLLLTALAYHVDDHGHARWRNGRVYDSDNGKHYDCCVWLADADHLRLHGFVGIALLGRTPTWCRVSDPQA